MPKLLSKKEVDDISAKMAEEYGLPPPLIIVSDFDKSYDRGLRVEIVRTIMEPVPWLPWFKKPISVKIRDFYAENFEDILVKLQYELSRFDSRTKVAEQFRDKYALQEADQALDAMLKGK